MSAPPPDPAGRPPPTDPVAGPASANGSTGSHRPDEAKPSLSDLVRNGPGSGRRVPSAAELTAHLAGADDPPPAEPDPDDAPTVITHPDRRPSSVVTVPPPPYVVGEPPSLAGRRLGHFELIEAVGAGGMAAVLKARDLELGRVVALKILPPEAAADPEAVTRFKQEARAAAKLDHENVARVYFCGEDQNLHFIAFEFVEGQTLRAVIDRRGPLPAGECVRSMLQVAAGLNHAADRGVVHRDIKPSNVIVTPDGRAKIVDMGLARHLEGGSVNGGVTQSGVTLGTFDYISPEQALDPRRADVRSDIYSLGCTFYHALTGRPPVPEGTAAKKLHAHQHEAPLDPRELNPAVPDDLAAVLSRMMVKDPARRYQTPVELIADLKAVAARLRVPLDGAVADSAVEAVPAAAAVLPEAPRLRT
ncbi:MAG: serine/threonine protein kinase, partial [Gemmataceae bacterium]|nr:serine/threonine protein kinase [Gemmataceae bacterium]